MKKSKSKLRVALHPELPHKTQHTPHLTAYLTRPFHIKSVWKGDYIVFVLLATFWNATVIMKWLLKRCFALVAKPCNVKSLWNICQMCLLAQTWNVKIIMKCMLNVPFPRLVKPWDVKVIMKCLLNISFCCARQTLKPEYHNEMVAECCFCCSARQALQTVPKRENVIDPQWNCDFANIQSHPIYYKRTIYLELHHCAESFYQKHGFM